MLKCLVVLIIHGCTPKLQADSLMVLTYYFWHNFDFSQKFKIVKFSTLHITCKWKLNIFTITHKSEVCNSPTPLYSVSELGVFLRSEVDSTAVGVLGVTGVGGQGEPKSLICDEVTLSPSSSLKLSWKNNHLKF